MTRNTHDSEEELPPKRVIFLKLELKDVINGRKWQNSAFVKLNLNTRIVEGQSLNGSTNASLNGYNDKLDYEKLESRSKAEGNNVLYYCGKPFMDI